MLNYLVHNIFYLCAEIISSDINKLVRAVESLREEVVQLRDIQSLNAPTSAALPDLPIPLPITDIDSWYELENQLLDQDVRTNYVSDIVFSGL